MLPRHEEGRGGKTNKHPDTDTHQASSVFCDEPQVLHGEDNGQETCDRHGCHEINAAIQVYIESVGADATEKIPVVPLALVDIVDNSQWQSHYTQQIRHGKVEHVDMERRALPVCFDQHHQREAVPN